MQYVKKLEGERIYLSPMRTEDVEQYVKWMNDFSITDGLGNSCALVTVESELKWLSGQGGEQNFAIVRKSDDKLIGNCGVESINQIRQAATVGIFIGEEENRSGGYGTEAMRLLVSYCFDYLNLHNVMLTVFSFNERAIACYKKAGFREFGRRREAYYQRGKRYDVVYMEVLSSEWGASALR